jgi:hypothetical protein
LYGDDEIETNECSGKCKISLTCKVVSVELPSKKLKEKQVVNFKISD